MLGERKNERERHVWYIMEPIYPLFRRRKLGGLFSLKASLSHEIHYKSTWSSQNLWFHKKVTKFKKWSDTRNQFTHGSQIVFHMVFQFVYCYDFPTNCTMYYRNLSFSISYFFGTLSGWNGCTLFHFPFLRLDLYQITFTLSFGIDVPSHTRGYCCIA